MATLKEPRRRPADIVEPGRPRLLAREGCSFLLVLRVRSFNEEGISCGKLKFKSIGEAVRELSAVCDCTSGVLWLWF